MRFLIGILTGTIVTLLVATAMDAPTHPLLNNAKDLAAAGWDRLINATSTSLFEPADVEEAAPTDLRGQVQSEESLESSEDTEPFAPPLRRDTTTDDTRLPRTLDVYAATDDVRVISLSETTLRSLMENQPTIAAKLLQNITKMLCFRLVSTH